jgi:hypothetical protein
MTSAALFFAGWVVGIGGLVIGSEPVIGAGLALCLAGIVSGAAGVMTGKVDDE